MVNLFQKLKWDINCEFKTDVWITLDFSFYIFSIENKGKYQPSGARGTCSPPPTPHGLQHLTARLIQNGRWGLEIGQTLGYWTLWPTFAK